MRCLLNTVAVALLLAVWLILDAADIGTETDHAAATAATLADREAEARALAAEYRAAEPVAHLAALGR